MLLSKALLFGFWLLDIAIPTFVPNSGTSKQTTNVSTREEPVSNLRLQPRGDGWFSPYLDVRTANTIVHLNRINVALKVELTRKLLESAIAWARLFSAELVPSEWVFFDPTGTASVAVRLTPFAVVDPSYLKYGMFFRDLGNELITILNTLPASGYADCQGTISLANDISKIIGSLVTGRDQRRR